MLHPPATDHALPLAVASIEELIARLPKAELHLHIEGTLDLEMMMALAGETT